MTSASLPTTVDSVVPITEIYCDVLQGEGSHIGTFCSFLRFTGCDFSCRWCDSVHTWKKGEIVTKKWLLSDVVKFLEAGKARSLIFTGGEPFLHQDKKYFAELVRILSNDWVFEIETHGLHSPNLLLIQLAHANQLQINCSPKLKNAGMGDLTEKYVKSGSLERIANLGGIFKFVVQSEEDVVEALTLLQVTLGAVPHHLTWLMPLGETFEEQFQNYNRVYDLAIKYGVNFSPRLHVLRHSNKKGV